MAGTAPHSDRWPPSQSLGATSQGTSQTSFSRLSSQDPQDLHGVRSRLEDILFPGEQEQPSFCFHHLSHYLKDSVAGMPTMCISNGPHYQVHVLKSQAAEAVSKRVVDPGIQEEHARALCWEALMLAVLAVLQPFITPSLYYIVCPVPANIQIIQERCSGPVHQVARLQAPHPRLAALSETERPGPPIPFADAISIMFQIALALSAAHSLKSSHEDHPGVMALAVIHGNVQPGNVLLRSSDKLPVICGWSHSMVRWRSAEGLQHVFSGAELPDDPVHNAPELQAAEDPQSALQALSDRTDVWGFALVSLFLLTGKMPYHGMRLKHVTRARDNRQPPYHAAAVASANADLRRGPGRGVLNLLRHCLAEDPEERPSMRQCVHALMPLACRFLQSNASQLHAAAQCTVKQLQEDLSKLKVTMDEERTKQDEQQTEYAESLPTYIPENVPVSLADLCQQAAEQQRSETFVLNLGSRPVTTAAPAAHGPGGRFRLPCGVRGGVFQLHDGDVLSIFGTQCHDMQCSRAAASGAPPPPLAPGLLADVPRDAPRVAFFGERAAVTSVSAAECSLSVSGACTVVEDCRVTGVGDGAGLEVVEARGDPMVHRKVVLRRCEASQCRVGLLVKGVPSEVRIEDCRFQDCREHNVRLQKVGTRACIVELERVHALAAARSGLVVETLCSARAVDCTFSRNGHYGVQVLPKAVVRMAGCSLDQNRRGKTSGNGVFFDGL